MLQEIRNYRAIQEKSDSVTALSRNFNNAVKRLFHAWDLFMGIMQVKHRLHKFVPHEFLSGYTLQTLECTNKIA